MARNSRTRSHFENVAVIPKTAHGDASGDVAFAIYPIDSDDISGTPTASITGTDSGNLAVGGTLAVTGTSAFTGGVTLSSTAQGVGSGDVLYTKRVRCAVAATANGLNHASGTTLLPAVTGRKYRLVDYKVIAVGGAVGGATGLLIKGTQTTAQSLVSIAAAALTENTVNSPTVANNTVLAAGASFTACDANTAITAIKDGSNITTATSIDVILTYAIE